MNRDIKIKSDHDLTQVDLGDVTVTTLMGAVYTFPDVLDHHVAVGLLAQESAGRNLSIVNFSDACLTIPWKIVKTVVYKGEIMWVR